MRVISGYKIRHCKGEGATAGQYGQLKCSTAGLVGVWEQEENKDTAGGNAPESFGLLVHPSTETLEMRSSLPSGCETVMERLKRARYQA